MACFWSNHNSTRIQIPTTEEINNVTYYHIKVFVGDVEWTVSRRYNEFYDLHNQLVMDHGVSRDILPSKKVIRNKSASFIETRRLGLEEYLQKTLIFLKRTMPKLFTNFLHFNSYDIFFLLQVLSSKIFLEADFIISSKKPYEFNTLEMHAISEFLKKPVPRVDLIGSHFDISPILELCSQLECINISGGEKPYLQSNIILNKLQYELLSFKNTQKLYMQNVSLTAIVSLGNLRNTLEYLQVSGTKITNISQVLQCDVLHKHNLEGSQKWVSLRKLDLSSNNITEIDKTICLANKLRTLVLNDNKISTISNLTSLPCLSNLSLANNLITICDDLHTKIGNIKVLNLSQNNIVACKGFSKLYSLEWLDLSCNKISEIEDIEQIGGLPCLENFMLTGNSVATVVDYRIKVLECFGDRAKLICLDNERPSQAELDKVAVLRALRIVREGKTPNLNASFS